jgi:hypothetical protein
LKENYTFSHLPCDSTDDWHKSLNFDLEAFKAVFSSRTHLLLSGVLDI